MTTTATHGEARVILSCGCRLSTIGSLPSEGSPMRCSKADSLAGKHRYAGTPWDEEGWGQRYPALAGPGWFDGPAWSQPRASLEEFYIGPDDDGESETASPALDATPESIAAMIVAQIQRSRA